VAGGGYDPGGSFNGSFNNFGAPTGSDSQNRQRAVQIGGQFMGMHESSNRGQLRSFLGFDPASTPWCVGFANSMYRQATGKNPPWGSALGVVAVKSWGERTGNMIPRGAIN